MCFSVATSGFRACDITKRHIRLSKRRSSSFSNLLVLSFLQKWFSLTLPFEKNFFFTCTRAIVRTEISNRAILFLEEHLVMRLVPQAESAMRQCRERNLSTSESWGRSPSDILGLICLLAVQNNFSESVLGCITETFRMVSWFTEACTDRLDLYLSRPEILNVVQTGDV